MNILLVGNPNSGKTTLFNSLTGKNEHVGNWAGVTIKEKKANLKNSFNKNATIIDLPGAYSIRPFTSEESVTTEFIKQSTPDVIINVVDSTNLERSLFFTTQILELNIPVVIALNKMDILKDEVDIIKLEKLLKCKVVNISAMKEKGIDTLVECAFSTKGKLQENPFKDISKIKDINNQDKERFKIVNDLVDKVLKKDIKANEETLQDKIDNYITNPFIGVLIFVFVMSLVFNLSINTLGPLIADNLVLIIENAQVGLSDLLSKYGVNDFLNALLTDGIVGGVGAIVGFVPLVMILMFFLALIEDSGFMARIALIFDPLFRKIGLSGKSIIPMVVGYGCSIPGIMSTRTIKDEKQRRLTAMLTPFVPCGAKVPIIALFTSVFFPTNPLLFPLVYLIAFSIIILVGILLKNIMGVDKIDNYFILELPEYKIPSIKRAFFRMIETAKDFIQKAGTIILVCNTVVFIMASFDFSFNLVNENIDSSILAVIAHPFSVLLIPLGIGTWQLAAAAITGFIAKEEVIATLSTVYAMSSAIGEEFQLLDATVAKDAMGITALCAISFMFFNLFTPPCFAAIGAMKSEMKSKKWLQKAILTQIWVGYTFSMLVYQIGSILIYKKLGDGFVVSLIILSVSILFIFLKIRTNKSNKGEELKEIKVG